MAASLPSWNCPVSRVHELQHYIRASMQPSSPSCCAVRTLRLPGCGKSSTSGHVPTTRRAARERVGAVNDDMPFGPIKTGARRGRPPKEPRPWPAHPEAEDPGAAGKIRKVRAGDVGGASSLDPEPARQTAEKLEAELRDLRARYEQDIEERVAMVCICGFVRGKLTA